MTEISARIPNKLSRVDALDAAMAGEQVELVDSDGVARPFEVHQWADVDPTDFKLFVESCSGMTIDVGCGPGRLTAALTHSGVFAIGIDVSAEAVRRTRERGALALQTSVFSDVPGMGTWDHALLADGNIGIGGDPVGLLSRVRDFIHPGGTLVVEVAPAGTGLVHQDLRFRLGAHSSETFGWTTVGADAIGSVAAGAKMLVADTRTFGNRHIAILAPCEA